MGRARVNWVGGTAEVELSGSCIIGRHPVCHILMDNPAVPAFWLEIRYTLNTWSWRSLSDEERRTIPAGVKVRDDWRALGFGEEGRVKCVGGAFVELIDDAPPRPFAVDLQSGETRFGDELSALLASAHGVKEHAVAAVDGRVWRFTGIE